jgi:hypothetical protein
MPKDTEHTPSIEEKLLDAGVNVTAIEEFEQVDTSRTNYQVLLAALQNQSRVDFIVQHLVKFEDLFCGFGPNEDKRFVPEVDIPLLYEASCEQFGAISQPTKPEDLQRWAFLVCAAAAIIEDFSFGNVIVPSQDIYREPEEINGDDSQW